MPLPDDSRRVFRRFCRIALSRHEDVLAIRIAIDNPFSSCLRLVEQFQLNALLRKAIQFLGEVGSSGLLPRRERVIRGQRLGCEQTEEETGLQCPNRVPEANN